MSFILQIWETLGSNSGQIQILIGILAFLVAVVALLKILDQIKISNTINDSTNG